MYNVLIHVDHPSIQAALSQDFHLDRKELEKLWKPPFTAEDEEVIREAEVELRRLFSNILHPETADDATTPTTCLKEV